MLRSDQICGQAPGELPRMLLCRLVRLDGWRLDDLAAPFWRLYAPLDPGAWLELDGRRHALVPGRWLLVAPGTRCRSGHARPFRKAYAHLAWSRPARPAIHAGRLPAGALRLLAGMAGAGGSPDGFAPLMLALASGAMAALPPAAFIAGSAPDPLAAEAQRLLESHLADPLSNRALAAILGLHPGSLIRAFHRATGVSPQRWAAERRLDLAATLLANGTRSLDDIAAACGFCDRNHLSRAFSRHWRCPPAEFRRRNRG